MTTPRRRLGLVQRTPSIYTPYLPPRPPPPAEILHNINLCFSFLLGITALPREIEKNAYAKLCHCSADCWHFHLGKGCKSLISGVSFMIFYTLPWSRWDRTHKLWNTCVVPFAIAELGQMSWSSAHTKIWIRQQLHHCTQCLNHEGSSVLYFKILLAQPQ